MNSFIAKAHFSIFSNTASIKWEFQYIYAKIAHIVIIAGITIIITVKRLVFAIHKHLRFKL